MNYQAEIEKLLNKNKFSIRFLVRFALSCARDVEEYDKTNKAKECNDVIQLWLNGKATAIEVKDAASTAMTAAAAYAAYAAAAAAYAANATAAAYAAYAYAAYAAPAADKDRNKHSKKYYYVLIEMIDDLTEIQKEFMS